MDLEAHLRDFTRRDWEESVEGGPVRVAMVGLGWWTRERAVPAVAESDYCETTTLVSRSKAKATEAPGKAASGDYDLIVTTTSLNEDRFDIPVIHTTAFMTGIGEDEAVEEIAAALAD